MSEDIKGGSKRVAVPFGDDMTPAQRVSRMLEIIDDLERLASLSQEEFRLEDNREEAGAYAAALGRCASKLPAAFVEAHPEIGWDSLEDLRHTAFHDGIDVLVLHDRLQETLPALKEQLERSLSDPEA
jgi:uncharacterized protein with HEPN domain